MCPSMQQLTSLTIDQWALSGPGKVGIVVQIFDCLMNYELSLVTDFHLTLVPVEQLNNKMKSDASNDFFMSADNV